MKFISIGGEGGEFSVDVHAIQAIKMEKKDGSMAIEIFLVGKESPITIMAQEKNFDIYETMIKVWRDRDLQP